MSLFVLPFVSTLTGGAAGKITGDETIWGVSIAVNVTAAGVLSVNGPLAVFDTITGTEAAVAAGS